MRSEKRFESNLLSSQQDTTRHEDGGEGEGKGDWIWSSNIGPRFPNSTSAPLSGCVGAIEGIRLNHHRIVTFSLWKIWSFCLSSKLLFSSLSRQDQRLCVFFVIEFFPYRHSLSLMNITFLFCDRFAEWTSSSSLETLSECSLRKLSVPSNA